jgi:CDP-diacylglycerol--serine O-phosphatidyltransferase
MNDGGSIRVVASRRHRRIPALRRGVYIVPNLFTSGCLISGFYSIISTVNHRYLTAAAMILVAQMCDVLDGRIARLTRSASSFGTQYDSLADLVAFGVAPSILVYEWALVPWGRWGWLAATLYVTAGALRLARFNVQVGSVEKRHFVGLPIPAAADVVATTVLLFYYFGGVDPPNKRLLMLLVIFTVAGLMVSEFRYFSFKEIRLHHRHPFSVLLGLILLLMMTIAAPQPMLFLGIMGYALSGPVVYVVRLLAGRRRLAAREPSPAPAVQVTLDKPLPRG